MGLNNFYRFLFMFVFTVSSYSIFGQRSVAYNNEQYTISKRMLSIEDGLTSHEVFCGLQDKAGFLWFGTRYP